MTITYTTTITVDDEIDASEICPEVKIDETPYCGNNGAQTFKGEYHTETKHCLDCRWLVRETKYPYRTACIKGKRDFSKDNNGCGVNLLLGKCDCFLVKERCD